MAKESTNMNYENNDQDLDENLLNDRDEGTLIFPVG